MQCYGLEGLAEQWWKFYLNWHYSCQNFNKIFVDTETFILKFVWKEKVSRIAKTTFKKIKMKWEETFFLMI